MTADTSAQTSRRKRIDRKAQQTGAAFLLLTALGVTAAAAAYVANRHPASAPNPRAEKMLSEALALRNAGQSEAAFALWERAAAIDDPSGLFHLGRAYLRGVGVAQDPERARELLLRSAELGGPLRGEAAYELGKIYARSDGPDCDRLATEWFHQSADWGYAKAHLQLGRRYKGGLGAPRDPERAYEHFALAAAAGHESAAITLSKALLSGREGIARDIPRAEAVMRRTIARLRVKAAQGRATATRLLGRIYRDGLGVPSSRVAAIHWFARAADGGDRAGMRELAQTMLDGRPEPEETRKALDWLRRAAGLKDGAAMTTLGRLHLKERHGLRKAGARAWLEAGVKAHHPGAMEELARLTAEEADSPEQRQAALDLARRGAEMGHAGARRLLEKLLSQQEPS